MAASLVVAWALWTCGLGLMAGRALAAAPAASHLHVLFAVDVSTSMRTSDPTDVRAVASRLFFDLLNPTDEAGLVTFGRGARTLVPRGAVGTSGQQRRFTDALRRLTILQPNTDMLAALTSALHAYPGAAPAGVSRVLIFMTDGQPDPSQGNIASAAFRQKYDQEMYTDAAQLASHGWRVYTVGLGKSADEQVLRELASVGHGAYFRAGTAAQLVPSYLGILSATRGYTIKDLGSVGTHGKTISVATGEATSRMVLVATRPNGAPTALQVRSPTGATKLQGATRQSGPGFTILSIPRPTPGQWTVAPAGAATVHLYAAFSRAGELQLVEPAQVAALPVDQPLTLGVRVTGTAASPPSGTHVQATLTGPGGSSAQISLLDNGQGQDTAANDSIYSGLLAGLPAPGQYTLHLDLVEAGKVVASQQLPVFADLMPGVVLVQPAAYAPVGGSVPLRAKLIFGKRLLSAHDGAVIQSVQALVSGAGGPARLPLRDDGRAAHADQKAGDRIYSGLLPTNKVGSWGVRVQVTGTFHDRPFTAVSSMARFAVVTPSKVGVAPAGMTGTPLTTGSPFGVRIRVRSTAAHPLSLVVGAASVGPLRGERRELSIPAHSDQVYTVPLRSLAGGHPGSYPLVLHLSVVEPDVTLNVSQIQIAVDVLTPRQHLLREVGPLIRVGRYLVPLVVLLLVLALLGDLLRYRPATRVRGQLHAQPLREGSPIPDGAIEVNLGRYHRGEVWVGGAASAGTDVRLPFLPTGQRAFRIYCEYERPRNWLSGSLQALVRRPEAQIMIETVWPYHVYFDGTPATSGRLYHQDTFDIGSLRCQYLEKGQPERPKGGTDLLAARQRPVPGPSNDGTA